MYAIARRIQRRHHAPQISPRLCRGSELSVIDVCATNPRQSRGLTERANRRPGVRAFTLVEMLVAMAITLVMMAAVVTLFANVSNSVRNRRAVIELSGQMRHVRNMLQRDLEGATCTGLTWQRPEHNRGYIEIIEGSDREGNASRLIDGTEDSAAFNPEIDHATSIIPSSNLPYKDVDPVARAGWVTDGAALGDHDDILMLTVRNEHEPFVGQVPLVSDSSGSLAAFGDWTADTLESPLAEVVWFAVENPAEDADGDGQNDTGNFFGEPGMRTVYRRALLIAPWINPYQEVADAAGFFSGSSIGGPFRAEPGLVRILPANVGLGSADRALAALIAFQDRYDLSVRLEWDPLLAGGSGRWKIVANTLGDLTKRENRYEHHFYRPVDSGPKPVGREYPFALASVGYGYSGGNVNVSFVRDPEINVPPAPAVATANLVPLFGLGPYVASYTVDAVSLNDANRRYVARPFAFVNRESAMVATARAMLNDEGAVVRVVRGLVPLWGSRRGEDVMLTDALAFDVRVFDPGAPLYVNAVSGTVLEPTDPGWRVAFDADVPDPPSPTDVIDGTTEFPFVGQGAYVDLGYGPRVPEQWFAAGIPGIAPWFFSFQALSDVYLKSRLDSDRVLSQLAPGYAVYDTWSFHYENNGLNEDRLRFDGSSWVSLVEEDFLIDEGTNGLDEFGSYTDEYLPRPNNPRLGPDDVGERETAPPYDRPLRGVQVVLRAYERDSRQIRQVTVKQTFVPE